MQPRVDPISNKVPPQAEPTPPELARQIWQIRQAEQPDTGARIPSERDLAQRLGVTRHAVRKAISLLEQDGRLVRLARRATLPAGVLTNAGHNTVGVRCITFIHSAGLSSDPLQWLVQEYLSGYSDALERHELKTRFVQCPDDCGDYGSLLWAEVPFSEQGCILINRALPALHHWLADRRIPYVVQYTHPYDTAELPPHPRVFVNKTGAGFLATQHLIENGHRQIGYLGADPRYPIDTFIYQGYEAAMKIRALPIPERAIWPVHTDQLAQAIDETERFIGGQPIPTAMVADNDTMALALITVAHRHGLRVPEDLSVVGVNDQVEAAVSTPPLTSVRIPRRRLARTAIEMFFERLEGRAEEDETRVIECKLIARASVAPCKMPDAKR